MDRSSSGIANLSRATRLGIALLLVVWSGGCGPRLPAGKFRVSGTVTYDSQPLSVDAVGLFATQGTESTSSKVGPDGKFTAILTPGEYAVSVLAKDGPDQMDEKGNVTVAEVPLTGVSFNSLEQFPVTIGGRHEPSKGIHD